LICFNPKIIGREPVANLGRRKAGEASILTYPSVRVPSSDYITEVEEDDW
jgi:hypothetical protein